MGSGKKRIREKDKDGRLRVSFELTGHRPATIRKVCVLKVLESRGDAPLGSFRSDSSSWIWSEAFWKSLTFFFKVGVLVSLVEKEDEGSGNEE